MVLVFGAHDIYLDPKGYAFDALYISFTVSVEDFHCVI